MELTDLASKTKDVLSTKRESDADVCFALGLVYRAMQEDFTKAEVLMARSLELRNAQPYAQTSYESLAETYEELGHCSLFKKAYKEAAKHYQMALQLHQHYSDLPKQAKTCLYLGITFSETNDPKQAEMYLGGCMEIQEETLVPCHLDLALTYFNLVTFT
mmetsp:Transcript_5286/g.9706  ORF Transcript_5286/g.9706 Transcript_5286/m.9706 type:complete len:160 (-) Transcript_5286:16-495(-)